MTIRRILITAGGLVTALAAVPRVSLQAQAAELRQDSKFILDVASANLLEIRLGQAAQSKATNPAVKQFGQQMVTDHNNLETQLTAVVSKGTQFQPGMNDEDKKEVERLEKLSAAEFDRGYMTAMIQHHQQDVATFQSQAASVRSAEARQIISNGLPVLQRHLTMAQQVGAQVGASGAVATTTPTTPTYPTQNPPVGTTTTTTQAGTTPATTQAAVNADMPFVRHASSSNIMEIRLGQAAQTRGSNAAVKQFGQRMLDDHTRMQNQLTAVVRNTGVTFTPGLDAVHEQQVSRIERLSGAEFDRAYMQAMIQGHREDVSQFQTQSQSAHSTQVRNLTASSLPILQQHLSLAMQVGTQVGVDSTNVATPNQPNQPGGGGKHGNVNADAEFIRDVGADNTMQVELARLATERAHNSQVRSLAEREIRDHTQLQNQWNAMVSNNGLKIKPGMGPNHREKIETLRDAKGNNFDRVYMTLMIQQHQDEVSYWSKEGRASHSAPVRNLVDRGLPTLEQHLAEAKRIGRQVGVNPEKALSNRDDIEKDKNKNKNND